MLRREYSNPQRFVGDRIRRHSPGTVHAAAIDHRTDVANGVGKAGVPGTVYRCATQKAGDGKFGISTADESSATRIDGHGEPAARHREDTFARPGKSF